MNFLGRRVLTGPESAYVYDVAHNSGQGSLATVTAMVSVSSIVCSSPPAHDQMSKQVLGNQNGAGATEAQVRPKAKREDLCQQIVK
jgi:hypothetical protein